MTDLEVTAFAISHGLTEEEASYILARRKNIGQPSGSRLSRAMEALQKAQKKVGVHPVSAEGGQVQKSFDQEAQENLERFYQNKSENYKARCDIRREGNEISLVEPEVDWEEPP